MTTRKTLHVPRCRRAVVALGLLLAVATGGCNDPVKPAAVAVGPGLGITVESQSADSLLGSEAFEVSLRVNRLWGQVITRYGLKTPYEDGMHDVRPLLPVPILNGLAVIRDIVFSKVPYVGLYPFEFWLVTEDGQASNHVFGKMKVQ
jgi:hypothetical protein